MLFLQVIFVLTLLFQPVSFGTPVSHVIHRIIIVGVLGFVLLANLSCSHWCKLVLYISTGASLSCISALVQACLVYQHWCKLVLYISTGASLSCISALVQACLVYQHWCKLVVSQYLASVFRMLLSFFYFHSHAVHTKHFHILIRSHHAQDFQRYIVYIELFHVLSLIYHCHTVNLA